MDTTSVQRNRSSQSEITVNAIQELDTSLVPPNLKHGHGCKSWVAAASPQAFQELCNDCVADICSNLDHRQCVVGNSVGWVFCTSSSSSSVAESDVRGITTNSAAPSLAPAPVDDEVQSLAPAPVDDEVQAANPTLRPSAHPSQLPTTLPTLKLTPRQILPMRLPTKLPTFPPGTIRTGSAGVVDCYHCSATKSDDQPVQHIVLLHGASFTKENWKKVGILDQFCAVPQVSTTALDLSAGAGSTALRSVLDALSNSTNVDVSKPVVLVTPSASGYTIVDWLLQGDTAEIPSYVHVWVPVATGSLQQATDAQDHHR